MMSFPVPRAQTVRLRGDGKKQDSRPAITGRTPPLKSFCMLTTVQPRSFAVARAFSEPASRRWQGAQARTVRRRGIRDDYQAEPPLHGEGVPVRGRAARR